MFNNEEKGNVDDEMQQEGVSKERLHKVTKEIVDKVRSNEMERKIDIVRYIADLDELNIKEKLLIGMYMESFLSRFAERQILDQLLGDTNKPMTTEDMLNNEA